jgi:hypothetical protein
MFHESSVLRTILILIFFSHYNNVNEKILWFDIVRHQSQTVIDEVDKHPHLSLRILSGTVKTPR